MDEGVGALPLRAWIPGRARTKGSMRVRGYRPNGTAILAEQVKGSKGWREQFAGTLLRQLGAQPSPGGPVLAHPPYVGPVAVRLCVWLDRPASGPGVTSEWPDRLRDGDLDKYQRNIGDALTDVQVIADDGQIVHWSAWKMWAPSAEQVGALVEVGYLDIGGHGAVRWPA